MIAVIRQTVARGLMALCGRDPNTASHQLTVTASTRVLPGKALDLDALSDDPSPYRDDATAAAARRLLDFHLGA